MQKNKTAFTLSCFLHCSDGVQHPRDHNDRLLATLIPNSSFFQAGFAVKAKTVLRPLRLDWYNA